VVEILIEEEDIRTRICVN